MEQALLSGFENWTLRVRPGTSKKVLLLLHGWTGNEDSMTIFIKNFPEDYWIVCPRAPYPAIPSGYSWRMPASKGTWPTLEMFRPSVDALIGMIDRWSVANGLDASGFDAAGFSQGGAMTFTLGVLYPGKVRKMGILSGFAPDGAAQVLSSSLLAKKNIFVSHGVMDEMVPIIMAESAIQILKNAGAQVTYCRSDVGHKLSADCLKAFVRYLVD